MSLNHEFDGAASAAEILHGFVTRTGLPPESWTAFFDGGADAPFAAAYVAASFDGTERLGRAALLLRDGALAATRPFPVDADLMAEGARPRLAETVWRAERCAEVSGYARFFHHGPVRFVDELVASGGCGIMECAAGEYGALGRMVARGADADAAKALRAELTRRWDADRRAFLARLDQRALRACWAFEDAGVGHYNDVRARPDLLDAFGALAVGVMLVDERKAKPEDELSWMTDRAMGWPDWRAADPAVVSALAAWPGPGPVAALVRREAAGRAYAPLVLDDREGLLYGVWKLLRLGSADGCGLFGRGLVGRIAELGPEAAPRDAAAWAAWAQWTAVAARSWAAVMCGADPFDLFYTWEVDAAGREDLYRAMAAECRRLHRTEGPAGLDRYLAAAQACRAACNPLRELWVAPTLAAAAVEAAAGDPEAAERARTGLADRRLGDALFDRLRRAAFADVTADGLERAAAALRGDGDRSLCRTLLPDAAFREVASGMVAPPRTLLRIGGLKPRLENPPQRALS